MHAAWGRPHLAHGFDHVVVIMADEDHAARLARAGQLPQRLVPCSARAGRAEVGTISHLFDACTAQVLADDRPGRPPCLRCRPGRQALHATASTRTLEAVLSTTARSSNCTRGTRTTYRRRPCSQRPEWCCAQGCIHAGFRRAHRRWTPCTRRPRWRTSGAAAGRRAGSSLSSGSPCSGAAASQCCRPAGSTASAAAPYI